MVLPDSDGNFTCSAVLRIHSGENEVLTTGLLPPMAGPFQTSSSTSFFCNSVQSVLQPQEASLLVWANPVSLAATQGIAFAFSSSGYLDVSVPRVCLLISYEFRYGYHSITSGGVSPFGNLRIKACLQLPEAYRCSSRPSSAPSAKASTVRPF